MILTKTVEEKDYKEIIPFEVNLLKDCLKIMQTRGVRIDIGHEHRFWEYGMALKALYEWDGKGPDQTTILDVGAGVGLLGPTLCWGEEANVTEIEPNGSYRYDRQVCNGILKDLRCPGIDWYNDNLEASKFNGLSFDIVFCISVIEHVVADHEFLRILCEKVKSGGLLFLTTDVMPRMPKENGGNYHFDNLREHNYTMFDICKMIKYLNETKGFELLGESDLEYKGDKVFDYSFASIAMRKK